MIFEEYNNDSLVLTEKIRDIISNNGEYIDNINVRNDGIIDFDNTSFININRNILDKISQYTNVRGFTATGQLGVSDTIADMDVIAGDVLSIYSPVLDLIKLIKSKAIWFYNCHIRNTNIECEYINAFGTSFHNCNAHVSGSFEMMPDTVIENCQIDSPIIYITDESRTICSSIFGRIPVVGELFRIMDSIDTQSFIDQIPPSTFKSFNPINAYGMDYAKDTLMIIHYINCAKLFFVRNCDRSIRFRQLYMANHDHYYGRFECSSEWELYITSAY